MNRIGAQLYTVRELLTSERATASVLGEIKKIGYDSVQLYGGPDVMERCAKAARAADLDIVGTLSNLTTCQRLIRAVMEGTGDLGTAWRRISLEIDERC